MSENFWLDLKKPIYTLAPMEDVTDTVFREVVLRISHPDYLHAVFTEFVSTDGLMHPAGRKRVIHRLRVSDEERKLLKEKDVKLVAQIWGSDPDKYYLAAKFLCEEMDFDGIDINFGCPVKKIVKQGCCSALIDKPGLAKEIIAATKEASNVPVSVKTRTGLKKHDTVRWINDLLDTKPAALILHGRTQKMMSDYKADWDEIRKAAEVKNIRMPEIPFLGNGDVESVPDAEDKMRRSGADGVMAGRGIFSDPWIFNPKKVEASPEEKLRLLWYHAKRFSDFWGGKRSFLIIRRFFKIYTGSFRNAAEIRAALMETNDIDDVYKVLKNCGYDVFS